MELGALGFWIFIAAIVVAGIWKDTREKAEKHETLRRIVEKTGTIDEAKLKELFKEHAPGGPQQSAGDGYRALRILGVVIVFAGAGLATFALTGAGLRQFFFGAPFEGWFAVLAIAAGVMILGVGVFFSSRFAEPPAAVQGASEGFKSGDGYRALRILGAIILFIGAGIATFVMLAAGLGQAFYGAPFDGWYVALAIPVGIAMLGLGVFFSSRFAEPPSSPRNVPSAR